MPALRRFLAQFIFTFIGVGMLSGYAQADHLVLITDPGVLAVRIIDNQKPMVNLKDQKEIAFGPSPEIPNNHTSVHGVRFTYFNSILKKINDLLQIADPVLAQRYHP